MASFHVNLLCLWSNDTFIPLDSRASTEPSTGDQAAEDDDDDDDDEEPDEDEDEDGCGYSHKPKKGSKPKKTGSAKIKTAFELKDVQEESYLDCTSELSEEEYLD
jgi:hypothetical protein